MKSRIVIAHSLLAAGLLVSVAASCALENETATPSAAHRGFDPGRLNPNAPPETALLGQLVGVWDIEQVIRNPDGSWGEPKQAEWHWYYVLDGHAIQDDWIQPPLSAGENAKRSFGTNLRVYNPETGQWAMAWIDSANRKLASFTAVNEDGTILMTGNNVAGRPIQNRFFEMKPDSFEWVQEWSFDEGATWVPVTRIHATRRE